jgi:hypothetical protein
MFYIRVLDNIIPFPQKPAKVILQPTDNNTGGTGMYIHTYQIHNVLNAYHKQLSQSPGRSETAQQSPHRSMDRIRLSAEGQKPKIIDNISSQIVDRIAKIGPDSKFEHILADRLSQVNKEDDPRPAGSETPKIEFTYTRIDELNHKSTSTLEIQSLSPFSHPVGPLSAGSQVMAPQPEDAAADVDDEKTS